MQIYVTPSQGIIVYFYDINGKDYRKNFSISPDSKGQWAEFVDLILNLQTRNQQALNYFQLNGTILNDYEIQQKSKITEYCCVIDEKELDRIKTELNNGSDWPFKNTNSACPFDLSYFGNAIAQQIETGK